MNGKLPNLNLQSFDEQRTPTSSEQDADDYRSLHHSQGGARSEAGGRGRQPRRVESSFFIKGLPK